MYILKGKDSTGLASTSFKTELLTFTLTYCRTDMYTQIPKIKKLFDIQSPLIYIIFMPMIIILSNF